MKNWIEYNPQTGQIYFTGRSPRLPEPQSEGFVIEVPAEVDPSVSVFIADTVFDVGERPTPMHVLDFETCTWIKWQPPDLADAQKNKWEEIKAERQAAKSAPVVTPYGVFDADRENITDTIALLQALESRGLPGVTNFTLADDTAISLTTEQMIDVGLALGVQVQAAFDIARTLRAQIYADDATLESVAAISWPEATIPSA